MKKLDCGCGLSIEIDSSGLLSATFTLNQNHGKLLQSMLCVRTQTSNSEQNITLEQFLTQSRPITNPLSIYLANRGDPLALTTLIGSIYIDSQGQYQIEALQTIGVPELRSASVGILPQQKEPLVFSVTEENNYRPKTDLHTHFSGVMTADILIQGLQKKAELNALKSTPPYPIAYPKNYLEKVGISVTSLPMVIDKKGEIKEGMVDITPLLAREEDLNKFKQLLHIPANKRITFAQMEEYYAYRGVFIQDIELFKFFLEQIAEDYQRQGINYAEISFAKVAKPTYLRVLHEALPEIEANTGVKIRFLAMLARTASKEMRQLQIQKYEHISLNSPYIVGIDLLSAEVNSTYDFYSELHYLAQTYPKKIIRVHAGETSYHPENVNAMIQLAKNHPKVLFRIGHGTYGVTNDAIFNLQTCPNITIEINMASNIALNMHSGNEAHAIDTYIKENISIVLGSDGHGLYQSQGIDLIKLLTYRITSSEIASFIQELHQRENAHIDHIDKMYKYDVKITLQKLLDSLSKEKELNVNYTDAIQRLQQLELDHFLTPDTAVMEAYDWIIKNKIIKKYFVERIIISPAVQESCRIIAEEKIRLTERARAQRIQMQESAVQQIQARFNFSPLYDRADSNTHKKHALPTIHTFNHQTPIMITGIIPHDFKDVYVDKIAEVIAIIKTLLVTLDCQGFYFATTGTDIGVQKIVHKLIADHNEKNPLHQRFKLVGYVPSNVKPHELTPYLTDIVVIEDVPNIYSIYKYFIKLTTESGLRALCFGGNMWSTDLAHTLSEHLPIHDTRTDVFMINHKELYNMHFQETKKHSAEQLMAMHGRTLSSTAHEMANLVLLSLSAKDGVEILTHEQKNLAHSLLTQCFENLDTKIDDSTEDERIIHDFISSSAIEQKPLLIRATLKLWQEIHARQSIHTQTPPLDYNRKAFLKSKQNIYDIPLGDKVAFKLSREDASEENYTQAERIAIQAVLDEQYRKRELKKTEELRYRTILILTDKSTKEGPAKQYSKVGQQIVSYLNLVFVNHEQNAEQIIKHHLERANIQEEHHVGMFLINALRQLNISALDAEGRLNQTGVNLILDNLVQYCIGEHTFERLDFYLKNINTMPQLAQDDVRVGALLEHAKQLISNYTKSYIENKHPLIESNTYIVNRLLYLGIDFDNIYHLLTNKNFSYESTHNGAIYTHGFYYHGIKILDVYWGDARFYPHQLVNGVQVYKKHRLTEDTPWKSNEDILETDCEYVVDKRNNFIKRFAYRFIRPTERMLLATLNPHPIHPTNAHATFEEIEGNSSKNKYFLPHQGISSSFDEALAEEVGELSLNRMGTYRFVTSTQAANKYDTRANNETLFLRHAAIFENIEQAPGSAWQGGGLIKIDLTYINQEDIRCQYKARSRVNMEKVKHHLFGVINKKLLKELEAVTDEQYTDELDSQLNKAKKSVIRNRETHFSSLPMQSIVGWKPYPQYPLWIAPEDVTLPIISTQNSYFVAYLVPERLPNSLDFLNFEEQTYRAHAQDISSELDASNLDTKYGYFLNRIKYKLNNLHPALDDELATKILCSIAINTNYMKKYINKKNQEEVRILANIIYSCLTDNITKYDDASITLKQLIEDMQAPVDKAIARWIKPVGSTHIYSSSIAMAFYMSPKKTIAMSVMKQEDPCLKDTAQTTPTTY